METHLKRIRHSFGKIKNFFDIPNLVEIQKDSFEKFLQKDIPAEDREDIGLQGVFKSVFPMEDTASSAQLDFVKYEIDDSEYTEMECIKRDMTYAGWLRVTFRLIVWDTDENTKAKSIRDIKEQEVFMGSMPLMTERGTFIFNGVERVVISQLQRSPGVFFTHDQGKTHASGKLLHSVRVIPSRGSWLDFVFDHKDILYVKIDNRRKLPVSTFLQALPAPGEVEDNMASTELKGMSKADILSAFYDLKTFTKMKTGDWTTAFDPSKIKSTIKLVHALIDADTKKEVMAKGMRLTPKRAKKLFEDGFKSSIVAEAQLIGQYVSSDIINPKTNETILAMGDEITEETLAEVEAAGVKEITTLYIDHVNVGAHMRNTVMSDRTNSRQEALADIYQVMRPGEPATLEASAQLFNNLFFDEARFDLSPVGRFKMNRRLDISNEEVGEDQGILRVADIMATLKELLSIKDGRGDVDDIDHLGNRRVRSVGELLEQSYRIAFVRMERTVRERISSTSIDTVMPQDIINARPLLSMVKEFFGSSQMSQFMDQDNPLAEITHKRRVSALGPNGLTRDRAGMEVRDVHTTHYGRLCPIETPEGANIGLISSLSSYAKINKYGFIETPYRKVENGKVTDTIVYLSALDEGKYIIAQANIPMNKDGSFVEEDITCRQNGDFMTAKADEIDLMDVSPQQIVSVSTSLIPFLENDDANRALMGSNMSRQAVPLVRAEAPFVGTGMERKIATDSQAVIVAKNDGEVQQVDADKIVVQIVDTKTKTVKGVDIYTLSKFMRSNQSTCINQKPLVNVGDKVHKGDVIADGHSTDLGELALGRNILVAFMPWRGYNYEDSILISERIVRDDVLTSIHISDFEVQARDTKLGQEEFTRDIPNVGEEALSNLDESGIIHIGSKIKAGDILVGRVTPKGETQQTSEEKLLRAIFGEKATDVKDTSLRVPPGVTGTVVDVRMFSRKGVKQDERTLMVEQQAIEQLKEDKAAEKSIFERSYRDQIKSLVVGQQLGAAVKGFGKKGDDLTEKALDELSTHIFKSVTVADEKLQTEVERIRQEYDAKIQQLEDKFELQVEKLRRGDDLPSGVLKSVKVYIAIKRKLQPGDKLAGRHGNKGVVSKVLPIEDMPYMADGRQVDIVLTPLGVPSRMNIGQILETHLGWAAKGLGIKIGDMLEQVEAGKKKTDDLKATLKDIYSEDEYKDIEKMSASEVKELSMNLSHGVPMATPVFDGANQTDIEDMLELAGLDKSGQVQLFDGQTGEPFGRKTTVGYMYILKLHHLVDEKIHARSVGPYSLVTQQPLGGKANFGGQRFGEMEVWALEAHGAAHILQEMLTVKSDDVSGRTKVYEAIVRDQQDFEYGTPESFNVLVKELQSLGMNIDLKKS